MAVTLNFNRLNTPIKRYRQNLTVYLKIYKDLQREAHQTQSRSLSRNTTSQKREGANIQHS